MISFCTVSKLKIFKVLVCGNNIENPLYGTDVCIFKNMILVQPHVQNGGDSPKTLHATPRV